MLYLMSACQRNPQTESRMQASAHLDSLARTCLSGRFDNPEEATRRLEQLKTNRRTRPTDSTWNSTWLWC